MVDIAGGTGNYARQMHECGFRVTVVDANVEMIRRSVAKVGPGREVVGDAAALPFADDAFHAAMCVIAVHLFADRRAAFREARRVVRDGPFVVIAYTRENLESLLVHVYFGGWVPDSDGFSALEVASELRVAGFTDTRVETFVYADAVGGPWWPCTRIPRCWLIRIGSGTRPSGTGTTAGSDRRPCAGWTRICTPVRLPSE